MAGGVRGKDFALSLPHLTRRELLMHRVKLKRAIGRHHNVETSTALLTRIDAELDARRNVRFENAARDVPPLYPGVRDEDV